jgi:hypothetical protein
MSELFQPVSLKEILHPQITPEMGFQSYEMLKGDGDFRSAQKTEFIQNDIINPDLDYPRLDTKTLDQKIGNLHTILSVADSQPDPNVRSAVWDSAAYRMAEMYWLKSANSLHDASRGSDTEKIELRTSRTQELNEQLYGQPEKEIIDAVISEYWTQIQDKSLVGISHQLKKELEEGLSVIINGETIDIPSLVKSETVRLPEMPLDLLAVVKEKLLSENSDIVEIIDSYWSEIISKRNLNNQAFTASDMYEIFSKVHALRDPENSSGVSVIVDPDATALSWETPQMAVIIGGKRAPIKSKKIMLAKVLHEYVVHGGRAINGTKTDLPVLGTGLFTEAQPGEMSDYLTFEEGLASICELAVDEKKFSWKPANIERYLAISLAYNGLSFRQIYETLWRSRVLMTVADEQEPSSELIETAKRNAYGCVERIFRGTPTTLSRTNSDGTPRVITYNKDLAYLKGKLQVIEFLQKYRQNPKMLDLAFKVKADLLNSKQRELSLEYGN